MTPAGTILVTTLTYPFGEFCGSFVGSGCSFELIQLCTGSTSVLYKPLHGLGGDGVTILNAIAYSASCRQQQQDRKFMGARMLVYVVHSWITVQV